MLLTAASNALTRQLKKKQKVNKLNYLKDINLQLDNVSKQNNRRITYKIVHTIVEQSTEAFPWISRNIIHKRCKKYLLDE